MQLGRYQVLKQLASGSIADVLLARASGLEGFARHVVIKRMRPELAQEEHFAKAFLDEARISASLNHQNIVQVHDIGEEGGAYYFAMEYVHGEDVRSLLTKVRERGENVPLEIAVAIIMAAASGLHHAHEKTDSRGEKLGIVHRDVSPSNILVGYDGSVKLVDFGLAKAAARSTQTLAGTIKGKASYMSPEQCKGETVDRRTDVFCLGIVLYELVTAQKLFKASTEFAIMQQVVEGEIAPPSRLRADVPAALDAIILRALARNPIDRYQTAEDLRAAVEQFAVQFELRTSNKALADYLTRLFGQRPEPWQTLEARSVTDSTVQLSGARAASPSPAAKPKPKQPVQYEEDEEDEGRFDDDNIATTVVPDEKAAIAAAKASLMAARAAKPEHGEQSTVVEPPAFESESDTIADTSLDLSDPNILAPLGKRQADTLKSSVAKPPPSTRRTPAGGYPAQSDARKTPPGGVPAIVPSSNVIRRDPSGISPPRRDPSGISPPQRNTPPNPYANAPGSTGPFQREDLPGSTGPFQREDLEPPGGRTGNTPPGAVRRNTPPQTFDAPRRDPSGIMPAASRNTPPGTFDAPRRDPSGIVPPASRNTPPGTFDAPRRDPSGIVPPASHTGNTPPGAFPGGRTGNSPPGAFAPGRTGNTPPGAFPRPGGYGAQSGLATYNNAGQPTLLGVGAAGPTTQAAPTGFKAWFAAYRSSILLGGGAGLAVIIIIMIVMRLMS